MDFALEILRFIIQAAVILVCLIVFAGFIASLVSKDKSPSPIKVKNLNEQLQKGKNAILKQQLDKKALKKVTKDHKKADKDAKDKPSYFVLRFEGDIKASAVEQLRQEVSAILSVAQKGDKVALILESPGGMVHTYGLAASQVDRIKKAGLHLTIIVDKVAASGGYMMACLADHLISAPFAIIGSIGVVASVPNIHKVLKKNDVDYLEITAGEFKRTLTPLGEITEPKIAKFKDQIEDVHELFKNHVITQRPSLDLSKVATGEYWYGSQALDLKLVDEIGTSDDFLMKQCENHKVLQVSVAPKKSFKEKLAESMEYAVSKTTDRLLTENLRKAFL